MRPGTSFPFGHAAGADWRQAANACLETLGRPAEGEPLGFLYVTDSLAADLQELLQYLQAKTYVEHWVGSVGMGICATGHEYYEGPAIAAMIASLPPGSFRVFRDVRDRLQDFDGAHGDWVRSHRPAVALVHGDPHDAAMPRLITGLAERLQSGFLVGGLTSSRGLNLQVADTVGEGGLSGVLFTDAVTVSTGLSQGCSPVGPRHEITEADRNVLITLDSQPALDVLRQDIGQVLARDLSRIGGYIFAALPIEGSDTGDYLVRNLIGIDTREGLLAIGDWVRTGGQVMFCRRDADSARQDLERMLERLARDLRAPPRGAVYVSCLGRGVNLFGPRSAELRMVREILGDFPLVGFYANGEIHYQRLYGYTGVLTLFL